MSKNLNNCIEKLKFIAEIKNSKLQKQLLSQLSNDCIYEALHEIAVNTIKGRVNLNKNQIHKLRKHSKLLKALSKKTTNKRLKKKLTIQSGGFLGLIIPTVASILTSLIRS